MTSCLAKVRRRFEANWERVVSRKEIMGAGKAKMVQIGHPMEGVHFFRDIVHIHVRKRLENVSMVLMRSILGTSMEHVEMTVQADREHVVACY